MGLLSEVKQDVGPYLRRSLDRVRTNWYNLIPDSAKPPRNLKGAVVISFTVQPKGEIVGMRTERVSGQVELDRAAWGALTASSPFEPLPSELIAPYLAIRLTFCYNPPL